MTTIAYKDGYFAWDSQSTSGNTKIESSQKVFKNGSVIFGVSGVARMNNILKYMVVPQLPEKTEDLEKWIIKTLVPEIQAEVRSAGYSSDSESVFTRSTYIFYVQGKAYFVGPDFYIKELNGPMAVGSGSQFAIGAMKAGASAKEAVEIAARFDTGTSTPVYHASVHSFEGVSV